MDTNDSYRINDYERTIEELRGQLDKYKFVANKLAVKLSVMSERDDSEITSSEWLRWAINSYIESKENGR